VGLGTWAPTLPAEESDVVDMGAGGAIRWVEGHGRVTERDGSSGAPLTVGGRSARAGKHDRERSTSPRSRRDDVDSPRDQYPQT
jgi:hypothetical protein